ncbi:Helix-turn-helix domain (DUF4817) [Popillia japonica]|uniref:Helix-turn-helix domain (DUF4817) n=1 Tax=Popillia japonica TaxID=7064 RepID=A0AAW1LUB1_POPJA
MERSAMWQRASHALRGYTMSVYTTAENVQIISWYFVGNSCRTTADLLALEYVNHPIPSHSTIARIVIAFRKYGYVVGQQIAEQPHVPHERKERDVRFRQSR